MNRRVVAGLLGLALAGCAQSRPPVQSRGPGLGPVGLTTFPSIHETINAGTPRADLRSLQADAGSEAPEPGDRTPAGASVASAYPEVPPHAHPGPSGHAQTPAPDSPPAQASPVPVTATAPSLAEEEENRAPATLPPGLAQAPAVSGTEPQPAPAVGDADASPAALAEEAPSPAAEPTAPPVPEELPAPSSAELPPAAEAEAPTTEPSALPSPSPDPVPDLGAEAPKAADPAAPAESDAVPSIPVPQVPPTTDEGPAAGAAQEPAPGGLPPAVEPAAGPANEPPTLPPAVESPPASGAAQEPEPPALPPLGELAPATEPAQEPPALPPLGELPPATEKAGEAPAPAPAPTAEPSTGKEKAPPESPAPAPIDEAPPLLPAMEPPVPTPDQLTDPAAGTPPAGGPPAPTQAEPAVPLVPPTAPPPQTEPLQPAAPGTENGGAASVDKADPAVKQTAADSTMLRSQIIPQTAQPAGAVAARVGDEVITLRELKQVMAERLQGVDPNQPPSERELQMVAASLLNELIERSIVVQEAKRELKKPEILERFRGEADEAWKNEEFARLLQRYAVANEHELKAKLKERGESLDQMREAYRRTYISQGFMKAKIGPKLNVNLPEMLSYYQAHRADFDRPAQITWREVVIDCDKCASRAEARTKVDQILARLRRNEDFATVAAGESHGPNKSKGGLWQTVPGGYGVEAVNSALERLPIGQISQVIESPASFHIVRVEGRRSAGPAPFSEVEVQSKIKNAIFNEKVRRETTALIAKLRRQTVVTTMFDRPASDPAAIRTSMPR